jgi:pyrrolidone-carboxylate peptidase
MRISWHFAFLALTAWAVPGCGGEDKSGESDEGSEDAVVVDNRSPLAHAQYQANVAFGKSYAAKCARPSGSNRPRVLVTGFGRFMQIQDNATGRLVSRLAHIEYPLTSPPAVGAIDPPAPQTIAGVNAALRLPQSGEVDVCGIILPVFWDLAAILIAKEIEAFKPDLVIMNGVAGSRQELYIELGSVNRAMRSADGSDILVPYAPDGREPVIVQGAAMTRGLRLSWDPVKAAAAHSVDAHGDKEGDGLKLRDILLGAKLAGFPRGGNTYLCNNVTYVTNYLMERPGKPVTLLKALDRAGPEDDYLKIGISQDLRRTPRVFLHWPSDLVGHDNLLDGAAEVLKDVIDAQLVASKTPGQAATVGTNDKADPSLQGGQFF